MKEQFADIKYDRKTTVLSKLHEDENTFINFNDSKIIFRKFIPGKNLQFFAFVVGKKIVNFAFLLQKN